MKKKTIIAIVVVLLALALIVGGIMAYFTSTDTATNTFTIGNVKIDLLEPAWTGAIATGEDQPASAQNMVPGGSVAKDPKIQNIGTNDANVFMEVKIPVYTVGTGSAEQTGELFTLNNLDTTNWKQVGTMTTDGVYNTYVYAYASGTTKDSLTDLAANVETTPLFTSVTLTTNEKIAEAASVATGAAGDAGRSIVINAYGIQTTEVAGNTTADVYGLFQH